MTGSLTARSVTVAFGAVTVLEDVSLHIGPGDRTGVVGPNGTGKSTLLNVLAGRITPATGTVTLSPPTTVLAVGAQEPEVIGGESLLAYIARQTGAAQAEADLERTAQALATEAPGAAEAYAAALDAYLARGCADLAERAAAVCRRLDLPDDLLDRGSAHLSGGQRARLALAALVLTRADVLLLDEPTNDLDDDGLALLEEFVLGWQGGLVVVSHDREFLARTITAVAEIDEFSHHVTVFHGGWEAYVDEAAWSRRHASEAYEAYAEKRQALIERARREREWARNGERRAASVRRRTDNDKHVANAKLQGAQNAAGRAAKTLRDLDRLAVVEEPREPWELRMSIRSAQRSGDVVFTLRDAVLERGDVRLGPVNLTVSWAERIRLTGPNGSGKSTLLDGLLGRLAPVSGERSAGTSVVVGELDQSRHLFTGPRSVLDIVQSHLALPPDEVRTLLAKFRIGADEVLRPAASLSPGERTRAGLAVMQAAGVNCLVLDEPTNHLDLPAIEQLETAVEGFGGTLLLVTHDRRLASALSLTRTIDVRDLHS